MLEIIVAFAVGIIVLALLAKIVTMPLHLVWKLVTNSIIGAVMLWVVNLFGAGVISMWDEIGNSFFQEIEKSC